jgi:hypothetical protein
MTTKQAFQGKPQGFDLIRACWCRPQNQGELAPWGEVLLL